LWVSIPVDTSIWYRERYRLLSIRSLYRSVPFTVKYNGQVSVMNDNGDDERSRTLNNHERSEGNGRERGTKTKDRL